VADNITGTALQTAVMHEGHLLIFFRPGIAAGRTGVYTSAVVAAAADIVVEYDMGFPVNGEAGVVKNLVYIHNALQAVRVSEMTFFRPTFFFTSRRTSLEMLVLGVPSMR
jgi:hypothetical protein